MKVKFLPQNIELPIEPSQSILELAHANGIPIHATCNGMPSCAECRVRIVEGEYNVVPPSKKELALIGTGYYIDQRRLSCQLHCYGDVTVDTSEHLERAAEGPITKKFLTRVQKNSAQESHSVGGVLIEQEEQALRQISESVKAPTVNQDNVPADFLQKEKRPQLQRPDQPRQDRPQRNNQDRPRGRRGGRNRR
jgi:ferredoxin